MRFFGKREYWVALELCVVCIAIATKEPLELVKDMESLVKKEFMPEVSKSSSEFVTRSVNIKLKGSPEENWNAARVKFYLEEKK